MVNSRIIFLALCLAACSKESSRVREARNGFYSALSRYDYSAIRAAVAPEYVSVDRGRFFGLDSLIADVTLLEQESLAVRYDFADSAVRVDPPVAWIVYRGRKILSRPNFIDTQFTVESATFKRDGGGWKLMLLHRTPVPGGTGHFGAEAEARTASAPPPAPVHPVAAPAASRPAPGAPPNRAQTR